MLLDYLQSADAVRGREGDSWRSWTRRPKQIELGRRVINRYGCFSCHDIKGFENAQSIGTELSEEGSKLVTRLDFAFVTDIPHTSKIAWFQTKLHDPRVFDQGRVLQPLDKLRMPNFDFSDEEVERLVTAIMSFQREIQPPAAHAGRDRRDATSWSAGATLVHRRNCVGCHIIEGDGGDFLKLVADPSLGPPLLTPEGARVQPDWLYAFLRGADHDSAVAERPDADLRPRRPESERRHPATSARSRTRSGRSRRTSRVERRAQAPAAARSCSSCSSASSATCSARFRRISRRRTWRPICGWRPTGCSRSGFWSG